MPGFASKSIPTLMLAALAGCATAPPSTLTRLDASGLLTVDCLTLLQPGQAPREVRFTARRTLEQTTGDARTVFVLDEPATDLDAPVGNCVNRGYAQDNGSGTDLRIRLPQVSWPDGTERTLQFSGREGKLEQLLQLREIRTDTASETLELIAGTSLTFALPEPVPASDDIPRASLTLLAGGVPPQVGLDPASRLLTLNAPAPGRFTLRLDYMLDFTHVYRYEQQVDVCAVTSTPGFCNPDPAACDCDALQARLADELAAREALYRYLAAGGSGAPPSASVFCIEIEQYSSATNWPPAPQVQPLQPRHDPPPAFLSRLDDLAQRLLPASACSERHIDGVVALDTLEPAVILTTGMAVWQGEARLEMDGSYYSAGLGAGGASYILERRDDGTWVVSTREISRIWQS